jgi:hypothetical protein
MIQRLLLAAALLQAAFSMGSVAADRRSDPQPGMLLSARNQAARPGPAFPDLVKSSEYPFKSSPGYSHKLQGVAHSPSHWYMTNRSELWKIPRGRDLGAAAPWSISAGIPRQLRGYNHLGDLDYYDGRLYVPLEGSAPAIGVFDADLDYIALALLPNATDAPWCAINPVDGHLYASSFRASAVRKYRMTWNGDSLSLVQVASVALRDRAGRPLTLARVQGGVFSATGHLYLVSDVPGHGIEAFDLETGRQQVEIPVEFDGGHEELEGIDIWDLDGGQVPGVDGQIHVQLLHHHWWKDDEFSFVHYRVTEPASKPSL